MSKIVDEFFLTIFIVQCKIKKQEVKKIEKKTTQDWISIKNISSEGIIKKDNGENIKILKIIPINYNLKSDLEKKSILSSYKIFLKTCNFNIQILIQSNREDLSQHIFNIENNIKKEKNNYLKSLSQNYIDYIRNFNLKKKSSTKNYYIIISNDKSKEIESLSSKEIIESELKEKYFKIKECLSRCGNLVIEVSEKKEILKILNSFFNTRKNIIDN